METTTTTTTPATTTTTNTTFLPTAVEDEHCAVPIIDISVLVNKSSTLQDKSLVIEQLRHACREVGFFYCAGHGVSIYLNV